MISDTVPTRSDSMNKKSNGDYISAYTCAIIDSQKNIIFTTNIWPF